ncbi:hypothetical protein BC828DRAFT_417736 [Blastocladiella britannica]|nr:hypothetical protein BC828DRAFT_417736 [Blastocladiella britannica]
MPPRAKSRPPRAQVQTSLLQFYGGPPPPPISSVPLAPPPLLPPTDLRPPPKRQRVSASPLNAADSDLAPHLKPYDCPVCECTVQLLSQVEFEYHVNACMEETLIGPEQQEEQIQEVEEQAPIEFEMDDDDSQRPTSPSLSFITSLASSLSSVVASAVASLPAALVGTPVRTLTPAVAAVDTSRKRKRSCPFYKWIPGTPFTVDAFCYGAVPGCSAYFLTCDLLFWFLQVLTRQLMSRHFHSDHYGGLSGNFVHGPIFASPITLALVRLKFSRVTNLHPIPVGGEVVDVQGVRVSAYDANHCPGAVIFVFELPNGEINVHVGDFRACPSMLQLEALQRPITRLFLDDTYLKPIHTFPPQDEVLEIVTELTSRIAYNKDLVLGMRSYVRKKLPPLEYTVYNSTTLAGGKSDPFLPPNLRVSTHSHKTGPFFTDPVTRLVVVCGAYTIGKEKIFLAVCKALDCQFYCDEKKWAILSLYDDPEINARYTAAPTAAQVHVVSLSLITPQYLSGYAELFPDGRFSHVIGIKPTGWTFTDNSAPAASTADESVILDDGSSKNVRQRSLDSWVKPSQSKALSSLAAVPQQPIVEQRPRQLYMSDVVPAWTGRTVACFGIAYSEHSSFPELRAFVRGLPGGIGKIVSTVHGTGSQAGRQECERWFRAWRTDTRFRGVWDVSEGLR